MKYLILLFSCYLCLGASSCSSLPFGDKTLDPSEAKIFEAPFKFECDGKMISAVGTASCQYSEGSIMRLSIISPDREGEIQIRSCRHYRALQILGVETIVDWVQFNREDTCPVEFSVTTRSTGTYFGKIYPYIYNKDRPILTAPVKSYCYIRESLADYVGSYSCQYPSGSSVEISVTAKLDGQLFAKTQCDLDNNGKVIPIKSGESYVLKLNNSANKSHCNVQGAIKYEEGNYDEFVGNIDYFDNRYRFVPLPTIEDKGSTLKLCAPSDYEWFMIDNWIRKNKWYNSRCKTIDKSPFMSYIYDSYGRISVLKGN